MSRLLNALKFHRRKSREGILSARAFTLSEVVISLAILGAMSGGAFVGFNSVNTYAVSSRLYTEAQAVTQNQADLILSRGPFNITTVPNRVPPELMTIAELDTAAATVTFPTAPPTSTPATTSPYYPYYPYYRSSGTGPLLKEGFIYTDPVNGNVIVKGTLKTEVTTINDGSGNPLSMTYAGVAANLNVRQAKVTVSYNYRAKDYNVILNTIRAADQ
jgi:prepilin-type N-terminal cleavage/methylation domain-containing protein